MNEKTKYLAVDELIACYRHAAENAPFKVLLERIAAHQRQRAGAHQGTRHAGSSR